MSKPKENGVSVYTAAEANEMLNDLVNGKDAPISRAEIFALLETAGDTDLEELTGEYFTPVIGETYHMEVFGIGQATIQGKTLDVVKFRDKQGINFISGAAMLVNAAKKLTVFPAYLRVKCTGVEKSEVAKGAKYFTFEIKTFPGNTKQAL